MVEAIKATDYQSEEVAVFSEHADVNADVNDRDKLFDEAVQLVLGAQQASTSFLQRRMKVGYSRAARLMDELENADNAEVSLVTVGRKGRDYFGSRGHDIAHHHADVFSRLEFTRAADIAQDLTRSFIAGETDRVLLCYSEFVSVASQSPTVHQLLPIVPEENADGETAADYSFEPSPEALLETLVPRQVNFQVWRALLETNAGFFAAQMTAMDNATKNAGDMIEELTREMNKERQASITLELMDIIGGAEAVA